MIVNKLSWMIGGPQGSGPNTISETFARMCCRASLFVFANGEYHSNIKGEHMAYRVRVSDKEISSHVDFVDLLVSLDKETLFGDLHKESPSHMGHRHEVSPGGAIIYDSELKLKSEDFGRPDIKIFPVPYRDLLVSVLREFGKDKELSAYQVMVNMVAFGASLGLVDFDYDLAAQSVRAQWTGRKAHLADLNVRTFKAGYDFTHEQFSKDFEFKLRTLPQTEKRVLMRGVQAVGIAKIKAGCGFQTYYPITPATDESEFLESHQKNYNMVVVQCEDEISAITMATGAAHAGVRAATSTSGPGFSLMAEGLGWAGLTEAPGPVVILYQRTGPSTGLPTRTEQGDLRFCLHASHGEFPRMLIAPGDVEECFYDTFDAFNYAERYQMPVILLTDKFIASSFKTYNSFNGEGQAIDRGKILTEEELARMESFRRYKYTELGVSPRTIPGTKGGIWWTTGDEHDEMGHINESAENRTRMMQKRMRKLLLAHEQIPDERKLRLHGPIDAEVSIVSWGSTKGAIVDAMQDLAAEGIRANFVQIRYFSPFPAEAVTKLLQGPKKKILIEMNYSGQAGGIIREKTGIVMDHKLLKFNGRPFSQNEVYDGVKEALRNGIKEVVMTRA